MHSLYHLLLDLSGHALPLPPSSGPFWPSGLLPRGPSPPRQLSPSYHQFSWARASSGPFWPAATGAFSPSPAFSFLSPIFLGAGFFPALAPSLVGAITSLVEVNQAIKAW